uniref:Uncharacterized protein n=1 Tax=Glossina palpalis gambiensis TaxID=67801 RepID=A0A1B0BPL0_9MUSC
MLNRESQDHIEFHDFNYIDYMRPISKHQDMRTSTYVGTKRFNDNGCMTKLHPKRNESHPYTDDEFLEKFRASDYKNNFTSKIRDSSALRNPNLSKELRVIKPFYEMKLKFLRRPMLPAISVTHSDFLWNPSPPIPICGPMPALIPSPVRSNIVTVNRNEHGYAKYLDPQATTQRLDYCHRSCRDISKGIAVNDYITFWNWKDIDSHAKKVSVTSDSQLCDKFRSKDCEKRSELQNQRKRVPNSGMTTEVRENYLKQNSYETVYDGSRLRYDHKHEVDQMPKKTECGILGSDDHTLKFL